MSPHLFPSIALLSAGIFLATLNAIEHDRNVTVLGFPSLASDEAAASFPPPRKTLNGPPSFVETALVPRLHAYDQGLIVLAALASSKASGEKARAFGSRLRQDFAWIDRELLGLA